MFEWTRYRRWPHSLAAFALILSQLMLLTGSVASAAPIVTVNSTGDAPDASVGNGVCDTGLLNIDLVPECTLRAAIQEANASSVDEIHFAVPVSDVGASASPLSYTIRPASALPAITGRVDLDATTQPDFAGTPVIVVSGSLVAGNQDGLALTADDSTIRGLVIIDWNDDGIWVTGDDNTIAGNYLGVGVTGSSAPGNDDDGIQIDGSRTVVGGPSSSDRNVVSGNGEDGVSINDANGTVVTGNYIGISADGSSALPNDEWGVKVQLGSNDTVVGPGNVISGNTLDGVGVTSADETTIIGNLIGTNAAGSGAVANANSGVLVTGQAGDTDIGSASQGNVISGNTRHGVDIDSGAGPVTVVGNTIGTNATGTAAVANGLNGVDADADGILIEDNLVSGNGEDGLRLERIGIVVRGNLIGTDAAGTGGVPNQDDGIDTGSGTAGSVIGGTGAGDGNVIAFNADDGVVLRALSGTTASIISNSIFSNGGLGIDLGDNGPTGNDAGDVDPGPPNEYLNFPVITSAATAGNNVYVDFDLDVPAGWHRIEFFANPSGTDPTGYGEGETLVGSTLVFHNGAGNLSFSHSFTGAPGDVITATDTYCPAAGCSTHLETSEFSPAEVVVLGNNEPVLDPISDATIDEENEVTFTATASDPDTGDTLTFSLNGEPSGATIDPNTGVFTWTPTEAQGPGTYNFDVIVTDDGWPANLSDIQGVTVTVGEVNAAPDLADPGDQTIPEQSPWSFTAAVTDPDLPVNGLTFSLSGEPTGAAIDPNTGVFTWTPTEAQGPGSYTFDITVTDDGTPNLTDTETITVTVDEANLAPVVTNPGDQANAEADTVNLTITATDADDPANTLTYSATGLPPGLSIDPDTGAITGTITYDGSDASPYTTVITVTDDGTPNLDGQTTFTWTVTNTNRSPVLDPVGDQTIDELTTLTINITANDPDTTDTLTFSLSGEPTGAAIDPNTGVFTWTPTEAQGPGSYTFDITVTDDGPPSALSDSETVTITVNEVNSAPVLANPGDKTVSELTMLGFTVVATDTDDPVNGLTYTLSGAPSGAAIDPNTGVFTWTPTEAQGPGSYTFDITVTDDGTPNLTDTETITVTVVEVNLPPVVINPGNRVNAEGQAVSLPITAADADLPANTLTYSATGLPAGLSINPTTGVISGTISYDASDASPYTTIVTARDNGVPRRSGQAVFTWTVTNTNRPPVLAPIANTVVDEMTTLTFTGVANDPDSADFLTYSLIGAPPGATIDPNTGVFTWTPTEAQGPGSYTFTVRVDDNGSPNLTASRTLTVGVLEVNRPPALAPIPNATINEELRFSFTATATDPDPGSVLRFSLIESPPGASIDPITGVFRWTPTEAQGPGTYVITVGVTDNGSPVLSNSRTIVVTVREVNTGPVAVDDAAITAEDTKVTIPVMANDSDIDVDPLKIVSVSQPSLGAAYLDGKTILYVPSSNQNGEDRFTYTISDGLETSTATVTVSVVAVNDSPVARDDHYKLGSYLPTTLDVMSNDFDVDGDKLGLSITDPPVVGRVEIEGHHVIYHPINGWTGAVTFRYAIADPSGASSEAAVHIDIPDTVLDSAQNLADELGEDSARFDPPSSGLDPEAITLTDFGSISLLADSFFQSVEALRIPLGFLGITVAMIVGFGATSEVPAMVLGSRRRHWAVVRLGRAQRLPAYSEPGGRKVVYNYEPTAAGIVSVGKPRKVGRTEWLPVDTPNGLGWIYRKYLTEQVDFQAFFEDDRPARLVHKLAVTLRKGGDPSNLLSKDGLMIALTGSPSQLAPDELAGLMGDERLHHISPLDTAAHGASDFTVAVSQPFLEAYERTEQVTAERPHSRSALIPTECWNFPYLALGDDGVQPWLVFFEYRDGRAWIAGLGIDE